MSDDYKKRADVENKRRIGDKRKLIARSFDNETSNDNSTQKCSSNIYYSDVTCVISSVLQ